MRDFSSNPLVIRSIELSLLAIDFCDLLETQKKYVVARQLLRCATSVGANSLEAQSAESKADFIHKLKISDKEAHETWYWLLLCERSPGYPYDKKVSEKLTEVMKLLNSILGSANKNGR